MQNDLVISSLSTSCVATKRSACVVALTGPCQFPVLDTALLRFKVPFLQTFLKHPCIMFVLALPGPNAFSATL